MIDTNLTLARALEEYADRMADAEDDIELERIASEIAQAAGLAWAFVEDTAEVRFSLPFVPVEAPAPMTGTSEITAGSFRVEVSRDEAEAAIRFALLNGAEQVQEVRWYHEPNRPGCLPAVVARSSALSVWTMVEGQLSERGINIH